MIVALAFHAKELDRTREWLAWVRDLARHQSSPGNHQILLTAAFPVPQEAVVEMSTLARQAFSKVIAIKQREENENGWPRACNALFQTAVEGVRAHFPGKYFLWVESDMIATEPGWLERLEAEYLKAGKPYMGTVYPLPKPHINGGMIYPANIRQYNPTTLGATDIPWDVMAPELTMRHAHNTPLMQRSLANPAKNEPHTFPDAASLSVIKPGVLLAHMNKDGTLIARLREKFGIYPGEAVAAAPAPTPQPSSLKRLARRVANKLTGTPVYYHSGNLGDVIYSLYAIKLHVGTGGSGDLIIGPEQVNTAPCANPVSKEQFERLLPLLRVQPYLRKIEWRSAHPGKDATHDLNEFRNLWKHPPTRVQTGIETLCQMHCHLLGVSEQFNPDEPWLEVPGVTFTDRLIVHRSPRHLADNFPWAALVEKYASRMLFVGLAGEHLAFTTLTKRTVPFYQCADFLDMARVIAGGCAFLGNQSFPCALAIGMGQKVFQEAWPTAPDCLFNRPTFMSQI